MTENEKINRTALQKRKNLVYYFYPQHETCRIMAGPSSFDECTNIYQFVSRIRYDRKGRMNRNMKQQNLNTVTLYHAKPAVHIIVTALIILCSALSADAYLMRGMLLVCIGAGLFAFSFMLSFKPYIACTAIAGYGLGWWLSGSFLSAFSSLLYLPIGAVMTLCLLRRKNKTTTVLATAMAAGIGILIYFSILLIAEFGTLNGTVIKEYFQAFFQTVQDTFQAVAENAAKTLQEMDASPAYVEAVIDSSTITAAIDSLKMVLPAYLLIGIQIVGYLAVSMFVLLTKIFRCPKLLPNNYQLSIGKGTAVLFMISYLIYFFSPIAHPTVFSTAAQNMSLILSPGLFILGLRKLKRRAQIPGKRAGFIMYLAILLFMSFLSPVIGIFFIVIDGIGEVFFENRLPF